MAGSSSEKLVKREKRANARCGLLILIGDRQKKKKPQLYMYIKRSGLLAQHFASICVAQKRARTPFMLLLLQEAAQQVENPQKDH